MPATRHKPLSAYPQWCIEIMSKFIAGSAYEQVRVQDKRTATSTAHVFNRARIAFCREVPDPRQVEIVLDIICRITNVAPGAGFEGAQGRRGEYMLEFTPRGLAILADEAKGLNSKFKEEELVVEGLNDEPPAPSPEAVEKLLKSVQGEDSEQFFQRFMEGGKKEQGRAPEPRGITAIQAKCKHELDAIGARCLHCGMPAGEIK